MKAPSLQSLADEAGVSKNTASLALRNDPRISKATRERIHAIAARIGYQRNPVVGALMAQMRTRAHTGSMGTLALFNAHQDRHAFRTHATIPSYLEGCQRRAAALGFATNQFWAFEPDTSPQRWAAILRQRGILGVILIGMMKRNRVPTTLSAVIEEFPVVVTGVRTREPALSFAAVDHYILTLRAVERALELGYQRPGLVLDGEIDELVDHRFSAGYVSAQSALPPEARLTPYFALQEARDDRRHFHAWLEHEQPDVIFTLYNVVRDWLRDLGREAPRDIGLIQLEWRSNRPSWAGMNQQNDVVGEAAVDLLLSMAHNGERGIPPYPRATLIGPTWMNGETVRPHAAAS